MREMFQAMLDALERGEDVVLVSVIASSGSVPRGEGAKMAVFSDGTTMGTIGGGAVEHESIEAAKTALKDRRSAIRSYTLTPNSVADLGMVCGGNVEICQQYIARESQESRRLLRELLALLDQNADVWLVTRLVDKHVSMGLLTEEGGLQYLEGESMEVLRPMMRATSALRREEPMLFVEPVVRAGKVVIFGGGHVSRALVPVLETLGFRTVVFEDRPEFAPKNGILGDFQDVGASVAVTKRDYAVLMTRGHQADKIILEQMLRTPATYIGMIGSRRKLQSTLDSLREKGFAEADFARLHSPIGLSIGAQTPEEIAISIAAEMIRHRAQNTR